MDDLNQVAIAGRLTRDPQLRTTRNGTTICNVRIACNKMFFNVKVWGDAGRDLAASASKGDIIQVEGRLDWYEWSPGDGPRREFIGVVANDTAGAVKCIATAPTPAVVMGDGAPVNGLMDNAETQDIASSIAAQSASVDLGFNPNVNTAAFAGAQVGSMSPEIPAVGEYVNGVGQPVAPPPQSLAPAPPNPGFGQTPEQIVPVAVEPVTQAVLAQAPPLQAPVIADAPGAVAVAEPPPSAGVAMLAEPPAPVGMATLAPEIAAQASMAGHIPDPGAASIPTPTFVAPAMPASLEGTEVPDGLAAYQNVPTQSAPTAVAEQGYEPDEIVHDPNAALAMDPEHEIIEEDNRFI